MSQMNCLVAEDNERVKNNITQMIEGESSESRCITAVARRERGQHPLPKTDSVY
jgi:hypothetical protein